MFYVYVYRDPRPNKNNVPVYVGKGQDNRAYDHWDNPSRCHNKHLKNLLNFLKRENLEPIIQIIFNTESEEDAFTKEIEMIALFGRKDKNQGTLFNLTDGGEGLTNIGEEALARRNAGIKSAHSTVEARERNRQQALSSWADPDTRHRILTSIRENASDPTYREHLSEAISAARSTDESRNKSSEISLQNWQNPEYVEKWHESHAEAMQSASEISRKSAATKAGWENPETRRKREEGIRASRTPELCAQIGESCKQLWTDEKRAEQSAKMKVASNTPEALKNRSDAAKKAWAIRKAKKS